jgi:hypothetical protein
MPWRRVQISCAIELRHLAIPIETPVDLVMDVPSDFVLVKELA